MYQEPGRYDNDNLYQNLSPDNRLQIYTFAWLFGFFVALLSYYVICKYISPITGALVDEAVLPPQKGDVSPSDNSTYETKLGIRAETKEVTDVV